MKACKILFYRYSFTMHLLQTKIFHNVKLFYNNTISKKHNKVNQLLNFENLRCFQHFYNKKQCPVLYRKKKCLTRSELFL